MMKAILMTMPVRTITKTTTGTKRDTQWVARPERSWFGKRH